MGTDVREIKRLGFRTPLEPDAPGDEICLSLADPRVRQKRIHLEGIDQDLDPVGEPEFLAPFDFDDSEEPLSVLLPDLDEIGVIRPETDKGRIEPELSEKPDGWFEVRLREIGSGPRRPEQVERFTRGEPPFRQRSVTRGDRDATSETVGHDDLHFPGGTAREYVAHQRAVVECGLGDFRPTALGTTGGTITKIAFAVPEEIVCDERWCQMETGFGSRHRTRRDSD